MKHFYSYIIAFMVCFYAASNSRAQSRILNLDASQYKNSVQISYIISPGDYCVGYNILRSNDAVNFQSIYYYPSVCSDGIKPQSVIYYDSNPLKNIVSYYQVFIQPNIYSEIVSVTYLESSENGYVLFSNPVNTELKIHTGSSHSTVSLYDINGQKMFDFLANDEGLLQENIASLPNGIFFFTVSTKDNKFYRGKILKQQ